MNKYSVRIHQSTRASVIEAFNELQSACIAIKEVDSNANRHLKAVQQTVQQAQQTAQQTMLKAQQTAQQVIDQTNETAAQQQIKQDRWTANRHRVDKRYKDTLDILRKVITLQGEVSDGAEEKNIVILCQMIAQATEGAKISLAKLTGEKQELEKEGKKMKLDLETLRRRESDALFDLSEVKTANVSLYSQLTSYKQLL